MNKIKDFESYLRDFHADQCEGVLDDDMPDNYEAWLENLGADDFIMYADKALDLAEKDVKELF